MTAVKSDEFKNLNRIEAKAKVIELKKELMKLRGQVSRGTPPENPGKIRVIKKNIARILTYQNQKITGGSQ